MKLYALAIIAIILSVVECHLLVAQDLTGYIAVEGRYFPEEGLHDGQSKTNASISGQLEYFQEWNDGENNVFFSPFFRVDNQDEERTHADIRDLYWMQISDSWELAVGIRKLFWGVTESQHLVDIINQIDLVESPNFEARLGQPMVHWSWINDYGVLDLFALIGFRERTFPGRKGRYRFPLEIIQDEEPIYEAKEKQSRMDFAGRWYQTIEDLELGLSFFSGTSREPRFETVVDEGEFKLLPVYNVIQQLGLEAQWIYEEWIWKLELITRQQKGDRYTAHVSGFEYTFFDIQRSNIDLGLLLEYHYDDRHDEATLPFENDLFMGARLSFNDVQSSDLLVGTISDLDDGTQSILIEGSRRVGESTKVTLEAYLFENVGEDDLLYAQRQDGGVRLEVAQYF